LRLAADCRAALAGALDARGGTDGAERGGGDKGDGRAPGRCRLGRGERTGGEGCRQDDGVLCGSPGRLSSFAAFDLIMRGLSAPSISPEEIFWPERGGQRLWS